MTRPGETVEKREKNCRIAMARKNLEKKYYRLRSITRDRRCLHVCHPSKLLQQVPGEERDNGVFRGNNLVRSVEMLFLDSMLLVIIFFWERDVYKNGTRGSYCSSARKQGLDIEGG